MSDFRPLSSSPIWGWPLRMKLSDFDGRYRSEVKVIDTASTDTTTNAIDIGARSISIRLQFENKNVTCDLALYTSDGSDVLVKSWTGLNSKTPKVYAGNLELVDLDGKPVKFAVTNIVGGWVSAYATLTA